MNNPYQVLGVENNAPKDICKKAYRRLSRQYHPDMPTGDADKFKAINDAWAMIESGEVNKLVMLGNKRVNHLKHNSLFSFSLG